MYSRNSRSDPELTDEEYELQRYDLPPKYDGSRFRKASGRPLHPDEHPVELADKKEGTAFSGKMPGVLDGILSRLGERLGEEELLIIALMLIISYGESSLPNDIILFLAILLIR